ncbi:MAG: aromatic hydrocarbon degradation protein [Pelodictyon luteolum]|uniref:Aromatic hydrocarbon degradation protein n=1 Tax=Pelodictyon luteolum TaxID=1100 RepID=A0A165M8X0_PELLU|nr:outer membrane protein transport protein [Pelodictyon luteolum]KZK74952.1 MAG: aromatic hydrocarbon degradation protein [Pelodictyon luteolum]
MSRKSFVGAAIALSVCCTSTAMATNGMNLEGYGAKSHAMGGAGMAYDTGNSAVMNNPATLGYMKEGTEEIGIGIRGLHPSVELSYGGANDKSEATAFYMPSLSYMRKDGRITWGAAVLSQGGMGTDYGNDSPLFAYGFSMDGSTVPLSGGTIRSEVGVGRVMFPFAYELSKETTVGVTADFVWASMDLQMDLDGSHFANMMNNVGGSVGGSMAATLQSMMASSQITDINYARFDFSNGSPFMGKAIGYGTGFKLGLTQKLSDGITFGASYHTKTSLSDLESSSAKIAFAGTMGTTPSAFAQELTGTIKVHDFEWPATAAAGLAVKASPKLMFVGDVKFIDWSDVMDKFSMSFTADNTTANSVYAGKTMDVTMTQNWDDQFVYSLGMQYMATDRLALRGGASFSTNPVPDQYLNPLFPAIVKNHYSCGFGYKVNDDTKVGAAFSWAPEVITSNADTMVISHGQTNWSLNFVHNI